VSCQPAARPAPSRLSLHDALPILISSGEVLKRMGSTRLVAYAMSASAVYVMIHFFSVKGWAGLVQPTEVYWLSLVHAVLNTVLRSEEHTSELQSREKLVCRLLLEK